MKLVAFAAAALLALSTQAAEPTSRPPAGAAKAGPSATAVIPVKGMSCGGCVSHVTEAVKKLDGVRSVNTDLERARTTVVFDPGKVKPEQIVAAIAETGYEPGAPELKR